MRAILLMVLGLAVACHAVAANSSMYIPQVTRVVTVPTVTTVSTVPTVMQAIPFRVIPVEDFSAFVKNWDNEGEPLCMVIRNRADWDAVFSPARTMGVDKPTSPDDAFFQQEQLLLVARVTLAPADGKPPLSVVSFGQTTNGIELIYRYDPPANPATYSIKSTLMLAVSSAYPGPFRFVEERVAAIRP